MILACLMVASVGIAPANGADVHPFSAAQRSAPELVVHVEETRLTAESAGLEPKLLVFALGLEEPQTLVWLPPGGRVESAFPRGAMQDLLLEVIEHGPAGWTRSGAHRVAPPHELATLELTFHASGVVLSGAAGGPMGADVAAGSLTPAELRALVPARGEGSAALPAAPMPTHVPIPPPSDKPTGDAPPKLEKRPLPPV